MGGLERERRNNLQTSASREVWTQVPNIFTESDPGRKSADVSPILPTFVCPKHFAHLPILPNHDSHFLPFLRS